MTRSRCICFDFCVRAAWRDRRCDLCPQQPPPTGEHLSARDTRTSVPFGGFGTCGAVAESPSAAAWREMGPGQLAYNDHLALTLRGIHSMFGRQGRRF